MAKIRVKVKTPSKAKIKRELNKAVRKNLSCPNCGRNLPYTNMSRTKCSSCGQEIRLNL